MTTNDMDELLRFFRTYQLKETELCFRREYPSLVNDYFILYNYLEKFILRSPYQLELIQFLFPLFIHFYLDLIEQNQIEQSEQFYDQFARKTQLEDLHHEFFYQLKLISKSADHLHRCWLTDAFRTSRFFLRLSMTSCTEIQTYLDSIKNRVKFQSKCDLTSTQISMLLSIFQQYLKVDINKQIFTPTNIVRYQTVEQPMTPLFVHLQVANSIQFTRLYTGVFPIQSSSGEANRFSGSVPSSYYPHINYNRLPTGNDLNSIPRLGPHQLPSICLFTLKPMLKHTVNCVTLSHDCQLLAIGCQSSEILICSMNPKKKLFRMKSVKYLQNILSFPSYQNSTDYLLDTTNSKESSNERCLIGHTAPIFCLAFEPTQNHQLLSGSQDFTIRLWHLLTWSCLLVYKIHSQPVLDVIFASTNHFFASCGMDGLLCLWTLEKINPIRIYPEYGHAGPIYLVEFHPNANYLASAHHDHTIHLWNIHQENSLVRIFNGHRHQLSAIRFSPNGHFLGSGCWNGEFILWDIQNNLQIAHLSLHEQAISSIEFSPLTGTLLLIGSLDGSISLWNCFMITKMFDEKLIETMTNSSSVNKILMNVFKTKMTPIFFMRFSKENILYAIGMIDR